MSFLKGAIIFTSGVVVGGAASYFYFRKKTDEKEEELAELKEHYLGKIAEEAEKERDLNVANEIIKEQKYIPYDHTYSKRIKEISEEAVAKDNPKEDYPEEAFLINEEDYSERELYFEKRELDWFVEDEVLLDEADEITDVNTTVGYDILAKFMENENEDVIYVRNAKINSDYMIHKQFGKYSDIVGLGGDDNED